MGAKLFICMIFPNLSYHPWSWELISHFAGPEIGTESFHGLLAGGKRIRTQACDHATPLMPTVWLGNLQE